MDWNVLTYLFGERGGAAHAPPLSLGSAQAMQAASSYSRQSVYVAMMCATSASSRAGPDREDAERKALALFRRCLTAEQVDQWDKNNRFDVTGSLGRPYRIYAHPNFNIRPMFQVGDFVDAKLCAEPVCGPWPFGDYLVHQKLWLENDEAALLRVANIAAKFSNNGIGQTGFVTLPAAASAYIPC